MGRVIDLLLVCLQARSTRTTPPSWPGTSSTSLVVRPGWMQTPGALQHWRHGSRWGWGGRVWSGHVVGHELLQCVSACDCADGQMMHNNPCRCADRLSWGWLQCCRCLIGTCCQSRQRETSNIARVLTDLWHGLVLPNFSLPGSLLFSHNWIQLSLQHTRSLFVSAGDGRLRAHS
jgi:hypothetical protein